MVIVSLLQNDGKVLDDFIVWCEAAYLMINVNKTKDMLTDFRKNPPIPQQSVIANKSVGIVSTYKYLGAITDDKLHWEQNTNSIHSKAQQTVLIGEM